MKYQVDLRWTNPGVAKYLIDSWSFDEFHEAFYHAQKIASTLDDEHFVEVRQDGELIAKLNERF
jgi:hypothetical protein